MPMTTQALLDNLEDAGCGPEFAERFWRWNSPASIGSSCACCPITDGSFWTACTKRSGGSIA